MCVKKKKIKHNKKNLKKNKRNKKNKSNKKKRTQSIVFRKVQQIQEMSGRPFGRLLDAGTGVQSLKWIGSLVDNDEISNGVGDWTAITASLSMHNIVTDTALGLGLDPLPESSTRGLVMGNWFSTHGDNANKDEKFVTVEDYLRLPPPLCGELSESDSNSFFLKGETFDTILVDYLIGAMDAFSPYKQACILERLVTHHLNPGGSLYVLGLEPIPDSFGESGKTGQELVCRMKHLRDASILLAGERIYREYPMNWVVHNIEHLKGEGLPLEIVAVDRYPISYSETLISNQLGIARSKFHSFPSVALAEAMELSIQNLEHEVRTTLESLPENRVQVGFDYIVAVKKQDEGVTSNEIP